MTKGLPSPTGGLGSSLASKKAADSGASEDDWNEEDVWDSNPREAADDGATKEAPRPSDSQPDDNSRVWSRRRFGHFGAEREVTLNLAGRTRPVAGGRLTTGTPVRAIPATTSTTAGEEAPRLGFRASAPVNVPDWKLKLPHERGLGAHARGGGAHRAGDGDEDGEKDAGFRPPHLMAMEAASMYGGMPLAHSVWDGPLGRGGSRDFVSVRTAVLQRTGFLESPSQSDIAPPT